MSTNSQDNNVFRKDESMDDQLRQEIEAALGESSIEDILAQQTPGGAAPGTGTKATDGMRRGKVVGVNKGDIFVNLGGRSQGVITADQFEADKRPAVGDEVEVIIDHYDESQGLLILTRQGVAQKAAWGTIKLNDIVEARVTGVNKGGLECDLQGLRAFMPASQVDISRIEDISIFLNQKVRAQIVEADRAENNIVLSRRKLLERESLESRQKTLAELAPGQTRAGTVRSIVAFGAFIDLGGVDGLLHVSDMSYSRAKQPSDLVHVDQKLEVLVLKIEEGGKRISLGLKQLQKDPWADASDKYKKGQAIKGKITSLANFGAFVEVEPGMEALIPIGEMTWKKRINHPSELLHVGDNVEASVMEVDQVRKRMSVSLKAFEPDPWTAVEERYPINTMVPGKVTRVVDFGAFVELEPGVEGLIHISELSDRPGQRISDVVRPDLPVQVRVLSADEKERRISLSLKGLAAESAPEEAAPVEGEAAKPVAKKRRTPLRGGLE